MCRSHTKESKYGQCCKIVICCSPQKWRTRIPIYLEHTHVANTSSPSISIKPKRGEGEEVQELITFFFALCRPLRFWCRGWRSIIVTGSTATIGSFTPMFGPSHIWRCLAGNCAMNRWSVGKRGGCKVDVELLPSSVCSWNRS
jgi:hypothetical protein